MLLEGPLGKAHVQDPQTRLCGDREAKVTAQILSPALPLTAWVALGMFLNTSCLLPSLDIAATCWGLRFGDDTVEPTVERAACSADPVLLRQRPG